MGKKKKITIAFMIDQLDGRYHNVLCDGISNFAQESNINFVIFPGKPLLSNYLFNYQSNIIYDLIERKYFDGILIAGSTLGNYINQSQYEKFFEKFIDFPMVTIGRKISNIPGIPNIKTDNKKNIGQLIKHLVVDHGYRKIAFIKGPEMSDEASERFFSYKNSLKDYNISYNPDFIAQGDFSEFSGQVAAEYLLSKNNKLDAIVAANDEMALGVLKVLKNNIDKYLNIAVTGFDNIIESEYSLPPLTTIIQPISEIGRAALKLLIDKINGKQTPDEIVIPSKIVIRQSCGCFLSEYADFNQSEKIKECDNDSSNFRNEIIREINDINVEPLLLEPIIDFFSTVVSSNKLEEDDTEILKYIANVVLENSNSKISFFSWENIFVKIRRKLKKYIFDKEILYCLESIFQKINMIISELKVLDYEDKNKKSYMIKKQLLFITRRLLTVFNIKELMELFKSEFPRIAIHKYYVFLYKNVKYHYPDQKWHFSRYAEIVLAADNKHLNKRISVKSIFAEIMKSETNLQMVLMPIFFRNEQLGLVLVQYLSDEIGVYNTLRNQISCAVKSSLLYREREKSETKLIKILESLELKVLERTKELQDEISKREEVDKIIQKKNTELLSANQELRATLEELEAMNQQFEAQNFALLEIQDQLEKSEMRFRTVVEKINDWFWEIDLEGKYTYSSPGAYKMLGYTPKEIIGKSIYHFISLEDIDKVITLHSKLLAKPKKFKNFINRKITKDGKTLWMETSGVPIITDNKFIGFRGIDRDITERKKAEEAVRESKQRLALHVEDTPLGVIEWDINMNVVDWNKSATNIFGYSKEEIYGKPVLELIVPKNNMKGIKRNWLTFFIEKNNYQQTTLENLTKKGELIICNWYNTVLVDDSQEIIGAASLVQDITEQKRTEEILMQNEKMMAVGGLAAGMAHEINNPLSIIIQGLQTVLYSISPKMRINQTHFKAMGISMDELNKFFEKTEIIDYLNKMKDAGLRASTIVLNMMKFSRKSKSEKRNAKINELIDNAIEIASKDYSFERKYDFRNIKIIKEYKDNLPSLKCNAPEIEQVVLNILKNSAQAMSQLINKKITPCITIKTYQESNYNVFSIEDNGPGIDEENKKHIFEPFFTTKKVGQGTGLGLSVAYYIITNNHNGEIEVESISGNGIRFIIKLPQNIKDEV